MFYRLQCFLCPHRPCVIRLMRAGETFRSSTYHQFHVIERIIRQIRRRWSLLQGWTSQSRYGHTAHLSVKHLGRRKWKYITPVGELSTSVLHLCSPHKKARYNNLFHKSPADYYIIAGSRISIQICRALLCAIKRWKANGRRWWWAVRVQSVMQTLAFLYYLYRA